MINKMREAVFRRRPNTDRTGFDAFEEINNDPIRALLYVAIKTMPAAKDLRATLIENKSNVPFITSDSPVILYNQYMEDCHAISYTGWASPGLQVFFPISPRVMLHLYDPSVYLVGSKKSCYCEICDIPEALKFKELQWINALDNIYYSHLTSQLSIEAQAKCFLRRRRSSLTSIHQRPLPDAGPARNGSLIIAKKMDLKTRLQPSFIRIKKFKKRVPLKERPIARDPKLVQAVRDFLGDIEM